MAKATTSTKGVGAQQEPKDLILRSDALNTIARALNNLNRYETIMPTREAFALLNGVIADIKNLKGE